jgi:hypothetical protein
VPDATRCRASASDSTPRPHGGEEATWTSSS